MIFRFCLLGHLVLLGLILLAAGCNTGGGQQPITPTHVAGSLVPTAAASLTRDPSVRSTRTATLTGPAANADASPSRDPFVVPSKEAQATEIEGSFSRFLTATVLTPEPSLPTFGPPEPTPTWALGMFDCGLPGNPYEPQLDSCWRGMVAGNLMALAAGHEGDMGDRAEGVLVVSVGPDLYVAPFTVYRTPQVVGAVRIAAVQGTQVFLQTTDSQTSFVFDVATRAWGAPKVVPTSTGR